MARINAWRIYIKDDGTVMTGLNVLDPAFKGSTQQKITLVSVPTTNNMRATVKLSNGDKSYATGLTNTELTESVEVEPGVFEEWMIWDGFVGNDILNSVKDFNATPVFVSFQSEEVQEIDNPNNLNYKGAYRSVPTDLTVFGSNDYIGVGVERDRLLNQAYQFDGVSFIDKGKDIKTYETDNGIVIKLSIDNVGQQEVPVSASTIGITELVEVTETDIINDRLSSGEAKDAKRDGEIGVDSELVVQTDFEGTYPKAVTVSASTLMITVNPTTGEVEYAEAEQITSGVVDEDLGALPEVDDLIAKVKVEFDFPNDPAALLGHFAGIITPSISSDIDSNLETFIVKELVVFDVDINDFIATGLEYRSGIAGLDARVTNNEADILELQTDKSDKTDTGLYAQFLQTIKDLVAGSGNTTESIVNAVNAIFPLIEAGAGDMLKAVYATLEVGKVDKAIQDSIGNVIHTFYTTKTESDLKQDITDALLATDEKEIVPAINELKSDLETTDQNVEDNLSLIIAEQLKNDEQDDELERLDLVKIEGVIIEDDGVEIATDVKTINAGGGLGIINNGNGKITIQSKAQVLASAEQELLIAPVVELPVGEGNEIKLDFAIKKDSSDDGRITVDINGDLVLVAPGDYDLDLNSLWINNNTAVKQIILVNVYLNDELGDPMNVVVDEAIGPGDPESTAFTPSRFRTQAQIEDAIAGAVPPFNDFPVTLKFFVSSDNTGSDLGVFDLAIKNFGSTGGSGGDMFKVTYDQNNNGVVDDADYDPTGDDIISVGAIVQSLAIKELDAQAFANKTLSEENKVKADNNTTNKQAKVPGDLNTTAASTSGGINENKARIDNNDTDKINRDGTIPMTGNLDIDQNNIIKVNMLKGGSANPLTVESLSTQPLILLGDGDLVLDSTTGKITASSKKIEDVADGTVATDVVNKDQMDVANTLITDNREIQTYTTLGSLPTPLTDADFATDTEEEGMIRLRDAVGLGNKLILDITGSLPNLRLLMPEPNGTFILDNTVSVFRNRYSFNTKSTYYFGELDNVTWGKWIQLSVGSIFTASTLEEIGLTDGDFSGLTTKDFTAGHVLIMSKLPNNSIFMYVAGNSDEFTRVMGPISGNSGGFYLIENKGPNDTNYTFTRSSGSTNANQMYFATPTSTDFLGWYRNSNVVARGNSMINGGTSGSLLVDPNTFGKGEYEFVVSNYQSDVSASIRVGSGSSGNSLGTSGQFSISALTLSSQLDLSRPFNSNKLDVTVNERYTKVTQSKRSFIAGSTLISDTLGNGTINEFEIRLQFAYIYDGVFDLDRFDWILVKLHD